jgi:hypothetical protein
MDIIDKIDNVIARLNEVAADQRQAKSLANLRAILGILKAALSKPEKDPNYIVAWHSNALVMYDLASLPETNPLRREFDEVMEDLHQYEGQFAGLAETRRESSKPAVADALAATTKSNWNSKEYADQMRKSTEYVEALFFIDSFNDIDRCIELLAPLRTHGLPDMHGSPYFDKIRAIYQEDKKVINFDYDFNLTWAGKIFKGFLRCQYVESGKYEIELIIPGVIANEMADGFKDGYEAFFCAFMPPAFYD